MPVITVTGSVEADKLGITTPHEHVYIDLSVFFNEPAEVERTNAEHSLVSIDQLGVLRRNPYAIRDNLMLTEPLVQTEELLQFKKAGGQTVVDSTTVGIGRDPLQLRAAAIDTGLNIVAGAGFYVEESLSSRIREMNAVQIEEQIVREIESGIDDTEIRAGIIGEIGISYEMTLFERRSLNAACYAQKRTGAPLMVHINPWSTGGLDVVQMIKEHQIAPNKVVICHVDVDIRRDYLYRLLDTGVFVEFDNFGKEMFIDKKDLTATSGRFATDWERVLMIKELISQGYENQLLISCDICLKTLLHTYGGWGYDHVLTHILPLLDEVGVSARSIRRIMVDNPAVWLDFEH